VSQLRKTEFFRFLCVALAVYLLNISIDPRDITTTWQKEDLRINEIESIIELVAEEMLDNDDVIPEHEDPDGEKSAQGTFIKVFSPSVFFFTFLELPDKIKLPEANLSRRLIKQSTDVAAPPPRS
jgi:hypothetical protein